MPQDERTKIGNYPTCPLCDEQHGTDADCKDDPESIPSYSIELLDRYQNAEAAELVLRRAADYIYAKQENGNPGNYRAVDILDNLREQLSGRKLY